MHPLFKPLQDGVRALGLELPETTLNRLLQYQDQLLLWNKAFNLTAIREPGDVLVKHLLDSLSIIPHLPKGRLLDIGTGGGMPGLIVALVEPERECVLLDSNGKKIRFLRQLSADMKVSNAKPVQSRIEDQAILAQLGQFDVVTSRAFASLLDFVQLGQPFLASGGHFAAMKGIVPTEELAQLGQYQQQVTSLQVPNLKEQRHLILLS